MELLNLLREEAQLKAYIRERCEDAGICIDIDEAIEKEHIVIIKVDDYYNDLHLKTTPPSVDCLIVQYCKAKNSYKVYLVELKNVKNSQKQNINRNNLTEKFRTTLLDFISDRFRKPFDDFEFKTNLVLYAAKVTDQHIKSFSLDFLSGLPMIKFRGKLLIINGTKPPKSMITKC